MKHCRSCKAEIRWVTTPQGRRMPLNAAPVSTEGLWGTWVILEGDRARPAAFGDKGERYETHFATCPEAAAWRN